MKRTVLITGASRGIGSEIATVFAENGYNVAINYFKSEEAAISLAHKIDAIALKADVSKADDVSEMVDRIHAHFGKIDVIVNNAGIAEQKLFSDITEDDWDRMFDINVKGMFLCTKAVLPDMIYKKRGQIINISSIWGLTGASCEVHYSSAKAAITGFTKALAKELGPSNIQVNCVAPGVIQTDMNAGLDIDTIKELEEETPLGRIGTPKDISNLVLFLASEKASFITGQVISPNGGIVI